MVLVVAALDAVVGAALVADGMHSKAAGSRHVGAVLLLCAAVLGAVPWLTEAQAPALPVPTSRV